MKIIIYIAANTVSPTDISTKVRGEVNFKDNDKMLFLFEHV